jgi:16S rRNA (uracil1498-N3)-methyltransferase
MSLDKAIIKLPRLYVPSAIHTHGSIKCSQDQAHYLKNVLRRNAGDQLRVFNGTDGEWLCAIDTLGKKSCTLTPQSLLIAQPPLERRIHAYFAPIKKQRLDILIEKATELGATDLHPVITQNTENRKLSTERLHAQIIEAAEQCERLDIPMLHEAMTLDQLLVAPPDFVIYVALERNENTPPAKCILPNITGDCGVFTGAEGGFTQEEKERLAAAKPQITPICLGGNILRAETAMMKLLSLVV